MQSVIAEWKKNPTLMFGEETRGRKSEMTPTKRDRVIEAINDTGSSASSVIRNAVTGKTTWSTTKDGVFYKDPSRSTVKRVLKEIEGSIKTVRAIPVLDSRTIAERLVYCAEHVDDDKDPNQLDESYFEISVDNRKVCCALSNPNLYAATPPQTRVCQPANADKACKVLILGVATCPGVLNTSEYKLVLIQKETGEFSSRSCEDTTLGRSDARTTTVK